MSWKKSLRKSFKKAHEKAPTGAGTAVTIGAAWMMGLPFVVEGAMVLGGVARDIIKKSGSGNDEPELNPYGEKKGPISDWKK